MWARCDRSCTLHYITPYDTASETMPRGRGAFGFFCAALCVLRTYSVIPNSETLVRYICTEYCYAVLLPYGMCESNVAWEIRICSTVQSPSAYAASVRTCRSLLVNEPNEPGSRADPVLSLAGKARQDWQARDGGDEDENATTATRIKAR